MPLPADSHVHSEWSWDAPYGSMLASCVQAAELGLPAIAFTEHVDHTVWRLASDGIDPSHHVARMAIDGRLHPPPFDATGYLRAVEQCRERFPDLAIRTGLELGEPHRHPEQVARVLASGHFDRVLGSVHSLADGDGHAEPDGLYGHRDSHGVMRDYLAEVAALVGSDQPFEVLAHVDYAARTWPVGAGRFDPEDFAAEFRHVLRVTADSGRALEVNTRIPLAATILRWWHEEGGPAITFGSDAHSPDGVARGFREAGQLAEARGFRRGRQPHDLWGGADSHPL